MPPLALIIPESLQQVQSLDSSPNQTWQIAVAINGGVSNFFVSLRYNEIAQYWVMSIFDNNQNLLLSGFPLLTGLNLLAQFQSLDIGSLLLLNVGNATPDSPNDTNLGSDFQLAWGSNVA